MLKAQLFLLYTVALFACGSVVGWNTRSEMVKAQQNPWSIVQLIGGLGR